MYSTDKRTLWSREIAAFRCDGAQRRDTSTPRDARRDYDEGPLSASLLPARSAGAARLLCRAMRAL